MHVNIFSLLKNHEISNYRSIEVNVIKNQTEFLCLFIYIRFTVKVIALHYRKKRNFFPTLVTSVSSMMSDFNKILLLTFFSDNFLESYLRVEK